MRIEGSLTELLFHPISLGIIFGLVLGKFIGIGLFTQLIVKLNIAPLPKGVNFKQIYGAAFLAGIGFTMSIFISDLAFQTDEQVMIAKVGVFGASIIAAVLGMVLLSFSDSKK